MALDELRLDRKDNVLLVLGAEGEGVSRTIANEANYRVIIPPQLSLAQIGKYPYNMIDSLNVGVSAALILYHLRHLQGRI